MNLTERRDDMADGGVPTDEPQIGTFVRVGKDLRVVVGSADGADVPDEHVAVWFGEVSDDGRPKVRTVPVSYCEPVDGVELYH